MLIATAVLLYVALTSILLQIPGNGNEAELKQKIEETMNSSVDSSYTVDHGERELTSHLFLVLTDVSAKLGSNKLDLFARWCIKHSNCKFLIDMLNLLYFSLVCIVTSMIPVSFVERAR